MARNQCDAADDDSFIVYVVRCSINIIRGTRRFEDPPDREAASRPGDRLQSPRLIRTRALTER